MGRATLSGEEYTEQELIQIKKQWLKDKAQIDANPAFSYYFDRDQEYERHLNNSNLKALFRHAARVRRWLIEQVSLHLYPREDQKVVEVYGKIIKHGYYSKSKTEEKKIRAWFGKTVSRQSYRKLRKN